MLKRSCPECGKKTLSIPLLSTDYICRECTFIFYVPFVVKVILNLCVGIASIFIAYTLIEIMDQGVISLVTFGFLKFLVLPFFATVIIKLVKMYFVPLQIGGVKGAVRRKNS